MTPSPRPVLHYAPAKNWMNDPNGLVFHRGRFHLYYQHNPLGSDHRNMSWGHASSPDLLTWQEHPVAIWFDESEQIYSGSIVVDDDRSTRFAADGGESLDDDGTEPLVAVYTSHRGLQMQSLAVSHDGGTTWQKFSGNPVLDRGSAHFRDPKVFRYQGQGEAFWVMVAVEAHERQVVLYRSQNLEDWTYLSSYGPAGPVGGVWECPDLFPLRLDGDGEELWVLVISLSDGGVAGGSGTHYVVGRFDGVEFTALTQLPELGADDPRLPAADWIDWGRDCYAGVTFNGLEPADRTFIAWMSNWQYARNTPTEPWRGSMTIPRRLELVTWEGRPQLRATPVLPQPRGTETWSGSIDAGKAAAFEVPPAARLDLRLRVEGGVELLAWLCAGDPNEGAALRVTETAVSLDRTAATAGLNEPFGSVQRVELPGRSQVVDLSVILDEGSIEVFIEGGLRTITDLAFLGVGERRLTLSASHGQVVVEHLAIADLTAPPAP